MRVRGWVGLLVVVGLLATGCSPSQDEKDREFRESLASQILSPALAATPTPTVGAEEILDAAFLSVAGELPEVAGAPDSAIITYGHSLCDAYEKYGFQSGFLAGLKAWLDSNGEGTGGHFGQMSGASIAAYCPEFVGDSEAMGAQLGY